MWIKATGEPTVQWVMEMYPAERGLGTPMRLHIYNESLHGLLTEAPHSSIKVDDAGRLPLSPELESATERVVVLAQRYVLGLLIMMQSHPNFGGPKERPVPPTSKRRDGPPKHRTFMLGRPIDVDCRAAIREYVEGRRRGAPSVQTLVIGHHKRQVIGVGRTGRKLIWVQPYWRGPEDAPILVRPRRIGSDERSGAGK